MKPFHAFLLLLVAAMLTEDANAWRRIRIRLPRWRIPSPICRSVCTKVCPKTSVAGIIACHLACKKVCKRDVQLPDNLIDSNEYKVEPMSSDFSHYDLNQDNMISKEEFAKTESVPEEEVETLFHYADLDGDGFLDVYEFETGPFVKTEIMAEEMNRRIMMMQLDDDVDAVKEGDEDNPPYTDENHQSNVTSTTAQAP